METVKLPREVAEAIEKVWSTYHRGFTKHMVLTNWTLLKEHHEKEYKEINSYAYSYPVQYMTALVNGYEVEQTPEDKVRELYDYFGQRNERNYVNYSGKDVQNKIGIILTTLNIKIEGVNA